MSAVTKEREATMGRPYRTMEPSGEPTALELRHVAKSFDDFAVRDVCLSVPCGSVVGLVGRNGAGKTTLMRLALGTARPDRGSVVLFGQDVTAAGQEAHARARMRTATVAAVCPYPGYLTIGEVATVYTLSYPTFDHAAFEALLDRMDIMHQPEGAHRPVSAGLRVGDLSRGQGMKLQLAACLATGADLLVLDEPTAGLDPIVRDELLQMLREHMAAHPDCSVLVSSHITGDLERLADYIVIVDEGQVVLSAEKDELTEVMGVARLLPAQLERVLDEGIVSRGELRVREGGLAGASEVLVPDRAAFVRAYPDMVCDRAAIEDVMRLVVLGRSL